MQWRVFEEYICIYHEVRRLANASVVVVCLLRLCFARVAIDVRL